MSEQVMYIAAIKLPPGKLAAQVGHAVLGLWRSYPQAKPENVIEWLYDDERQDKGVQAKVVLKIENEQQYVDLICFLMEQKIPYYIVTDAGRTVVESGTMTAISWGPVAKDLEGPWRTMKLY